MKWDILTLKKITCLSDIQISLGILYFYLLNPSNYLSRWQEGKCVSPYCFERMGKSKTESKRNSLVFLRGLCQNQHVSVTETNSALGGSPAFAKVPTTLGRGTNFACLPGQDRTHGTRIGFTEERSWQPIFLRPTDAFSVVWWRSHRVKDVSFFFHLFTHLADMHGTPTMCQVLLKGSESTEMNKTWTSSLMEHIPVAGGKTRSVAEQVTQGPGEAHHPNTSSPVSVFLLKKLRTGRREWK